LWPYNAGELAKPPRIEVTSQIMSHEKQGNFFLRRLIQFFDDSKYGVDAVEHEFQIWSLLSVNKEAKVPVSHHLTSEMFQVIQCRIEMFGELIGV
jgi:hypothetical protein